MRFAIVIALFAGVALASPSLMEPRAYYGPCSSSDCGASHLNCGNRICVGWPTTDPATRKGCTCSSG
jgi:hypothetical protein